MLIIKNNLKKNQKIGRIETMKLAVNLSLYTFVFFSFSTESFSLTDYQIKRYCTKKKRVSLCIKDLQEKRSNLQKGKLIEIPVIRYKGN